HDHRHGCLVIAGAAGARVIHDVNTQVGVVTWRGGEKGHVKDDHFEFATHTHTHTTTHTHPHTHTHTHTHTHIHTIHEQMVNCLIHPTKRTFLPYRWIQ